MLTPKPSGSRLIVMYHILLFEQRLTDVTAEKSELSVRVRFAGGLRMLFFSSMREMGALLLPGLHQGLRYILCCSKISESHLTLQR